MEVQLQSILRPSKDICDVSALYYHQYADRIELDGYFNLFYIEKRKAYTTIERLFLSIRAKGYDSLILYHDRTAVEEIALEPEMEKSYKVELPYQQYQDGVFWIAATMGKKASGERQREGQDGELPGDGDDRRAQECDGDDIRLLEGMFVAEVEERAVRPVDIGIDICTYRREPYVSRNLAQLKTRLLDREELEVSSHIRIYVVDNGKTLDTHPDIQQTVASSHGRIQIFPNKNAGGAGGFTRGMLEILREKEAYHLTHVLLMDDDAIVEPDTLVRLYGLLRTLRPEWEDAAVGGGLMREDHPHILFCAGEAWENGTVLHPEKNLDVRDFDTAVCPYLTSTGNERSWYSAWWCCCFSLKVVREDNLPLPVFIHQDDIEFGQRNQKKGFLFLNGINVWHRGFELSFNASTLYYDIRNGAIAIALYGTGDRKRAILCFVMRSLTVAVIRMRDQDAETVYQGALDFLKGPSWLWRQDPVRLNDQVRRLISQYVPVEEVMGQLTEKEAMDLQRQIEGFWDGFSMEKILESPERKKKASWLHLVTFNGLLLPHDRTRIKMLTSLDPPWEVFRKKKVVWYEPGSKKALLVQRDMRKTKKMLRLYMKIWIASHRYLDAALADYQKNMVRMSDGKAWKEYLKEK